MYRQQSTVQRSLRDTWQVLDDSEQSLTLERSKTKTSRRSSAPITIFSAYDGSETQEASRGILPTHIGGVFAGHEGGQAKRAESVATASQVMTSMSTALEEVLESVDATTEMHQQARSNTRIQDWLGEQSELHHEKKRKRTQEERQRVKRVTEGILRHLLGIDQSVLDILFRPDQHDSRSAADVETQIWKRWIELARRDTASLRTSASSGKAGVSQPSQSAAQTVSGRRTSLEKIPWGVPEDSHEDNYWNEKISLPMIFKYIKARLSQKRTSESHTANEDDKVFEDERPISDTSSQYFAPRNQFVSTQTEESTTPVAKRSMAAVSDITPTAVSRQTLARLLRTTHRSNHLRSRSKTSRSSSFKTVSVTGTCSVASMRRSALGSNFWDLGSLGGASVNSREVGNWSVHI